MSCRPVINQFVTGMALDNPNVGGYLKASLTGQDPAALGIELLATKRSAIRCDNALQLMYPKSGAGTSIVGVDPISASLYGPKVFISADPTTGVVAIVGSALTFNGVPITVP